MWIDQPTTVGEALANLTEENWHTERVLIERRISMLEDLVRVLPESDISGEKDVESELTPEHLALLHEVWDAQRR